jgi:hypothetical protein
MLFKSISERKKRESPSLVEAAEESVTSVTAGRQLQCRILVMLVTEVTDARVENVGTMRGGSPGRPQPSHFSGSPAFSIGSRIALRVRFPPARRHTCAEEVDGEVAQVRPPAAGPGVDRERASATVTAFVRPHARLLAPVAAVKVLHGCSQRPPGGRQGPTTVRPTTPVSLGQLATRPGEGGAHTSPRATASLWGRREWPLSVC